MTDNYTLVFTDPDNLNTIEIVPYSIDYSTSLTFYGKNALNYWHDLNNNLLLLLTNFGHKNPPLHPIVGQIWYDATNKLLKYFDKTWQTIVPPQLDLSMFVQQSGDTLNGNLIILNQGFNAKSITTRGYIEQQLAKCTYGDEKGTCWVKHSGSNYVVLSTYATKAKQTVTLPFEMADTQYSIVASPNDTANSNDGLHWTTYNKTTKDFQIVFAGSVQTLAIVITGFAK